MIREGRVSWQVLRAVVAAEDLGAPEPGDATHRRKQLHEQELLVCAGVGARRPPAP